MNEIKYRHSKRSKLTIKIIELAEIIIIVLVQECRSVHYFNADARRSVLRSRMTPLFIFRLIFTYIW